MSDSALVLAYIAKGNEALTTAGDTDVKAYLAAASELLTLKAKAKPSPAPAGDHDIEEDVRTKRPRTKGPGGAADEMLRRTVNLLLEDDPAVDRACQLIAERRFGHEHVGDSALLAHPKVWRALFDSPGSLPMTALLRNLGRLSALGVMASREAEVVARFRSAEAVQKARLHPITLLEALRVYSSGHGIKGSLAWSPSQGVLNALEDAFYTSFKNVEPTGLRYLLGVDVSGSMDGAQVCGMQSLTARDAAAAILMALMRTEAAGERVGQPGRRVTPMAFSSGFQELRVDAGMRLEEVKHVMDGLSFDSTDCAQPMLYALRHRIAVDVFVVFTDNETYYGSVSEGHECVRGLSVV